MVKMKTVQKSENKNEIPTIQSKSTIRSFLWFFPEMSSEPDSQAHFYFHKWGHTTPMFLKLAFV